MPKYLVTVSIEDWDQIEIEADTKEDAKQQALEYYSEFPIIVVEKVEELAYD